MRTNGYILLKTKVGGGINPETGYPTAPLITWSERIPCYYKANNYNQLGVTNGMAFTSASYQILILQQPVESEVLKLYNNRGDELGEYPIMQVEEVEVKGRTKIMV